MPRIDFYILQEAGLSARLQFACKFIEKAYKNKHKVYIHTENQNDAHTLDELLWTYRDDSFIPHHLVGDGPKPPPPIQIGFQLKPESQYDILLNLSQTVPEFYKKFARIVELVTSDEPTQNLLRNHYRLYRANGHEITTHNINLT